MTVNHKDLPNSELHEPKDVNNANSGDVYVANGSGSGAWKKPGGAEFGEMYFTGKSVALSIAAAGTAYLINGANLVTPAALWTQGESDTINYINTSNDERFQVLKNGIYEFTFKLSFTGTGTSAGDVYGLNFAKNGTLITSKPWARDNCPTGEISEISASYLVTLAANDTVQPMIRNETNASNPTLREGSFHLILLKES